MGLNCCYVFVFVAKLTKTWWQNAESNNTWTICAHLNIRKLVSVMTFLFDICCSLSWLFRFSSLVYVTVWCCLSLRAVANQKAKVEWYWWFILNITFTVGLLKNMVVKQKPTILSYSENKGNNTLISSQ